MLKEKDFFVVYEGKEIKLITLLNKNGNCVQITNYGARIASFIVNGIDSVIGFENIQGYLNAKERYFNATIGRYANRIKEGKFLLNGKPQQVTINNGVNHLHGGKNGLNEIVWDILETKQNYVKMETLLLDGQDGFTGNLRVQVSYNFEDDNSLKINFWATCDKDTIINLTNHAFFNLSKDHNKKITDTFLQINADYFLPIDKTSIPYGAFAKVENTPFDFREIKLIGKDILEENEQLKNGNGYDHCFVLKDKTFSAKAINKESSLMLEVFTTEPGLQLYTGNFLEGKDCGKGGITYFQRQAFCLEAQHFPDSPNHKEYPSVFLQAGQVFNSEIIYKISKINV